MSTDLQTQYQSVADEVVATSPATQSKMFGMPCLKIGGKTFAGLTKNAMVFKLSIPEHTKALSLSGAQLFDPSGRGRPMREWVEVPMEHASLWLELAQAAARYVAESAL